MVKRRTIIILGGLGALFCSNFYSIYFCLTILNPIKAGRFEGSEKLGSKSVFNDNTKVAVK